MDASPINARLEAASRDLDAVIDLAFCRLQADLVRAYPGINLEAVAAEEDEFFEACRVLKKECMDLIEAVAIACEAMAVTFERGY